MDLTARHLVFGILLSSLAASPVVGQLSEEIPHAPYYAGSEAFYLGEYRDAERILRRETQRGFRAGQVRWIDAICYHAMLGEVLYHQGRNAEALANFDQACQVLLTYPNWLLQVRFQSVTGGLRPDLNRGRRVPPWGQSGRQFVVGQFSDTEQVLIGEVNINPNTLRQGGVVQTPMLWRVNVVEVVRMSALAIRRRNELLGPLSAHDSLSKELSDVLSRGNLALAGHWSSAWINLLRGLAQAGIGRLDEADTLLGRSLVVEGQFDHPLTSVALLEQGRIALARGDNRRAGQMLAEAGYSAYYFENWDVLTESVFLGWLNHTTSGGPGVYPPLQLVGAWAQASRLQHVTAKLRLAHAESLVSIGELDAAGALVEDATRRLGEMRTGLTGIHQLYVQATAQIMRGQLGTGFEALQQAIAAQAGASLRNFQIARAGEMYDARLLPPRVAVGVYGSLLNDPASTDWAVQPLDAMAVLSSSHDDAFDRWFLAALERKDIPLALEIAERAKRRRFLAGIPLGGRLAALGTILESPEAELSREAKLQRQQIQTSRPAYKALADAGRQLEDQLRAGPVLAGGPADVKPLAALYDNWAKNIVQRQELLAQLAVRRLPSAIEFPPMRSEQELHEALVEGEALVVFHVAAETMYGFLITQTDVHLWQIADLRRLRTGLGKFLQSIGNYGPNRQLSVAELRSGAWRKTAAATYATIFAGARLDLGKTSALVIVPDDVLWYLPFDAMVPDPAKSEMVLADRVPIRYGPTAALAIGNEQPLRRTQRTGIVANQRSAEDDAEAIDEMIQELEKVVVGPLRLPSPLPEPPQFISPLLDTLVGFDDIEANPEAPYGWSALPEARGVARDSLDALFGLPHGGPQQIVLTGFTTAAEQGLKGSRRGGARAARPGSEVFQSLCGLMADGARTIVLTRWRTGGRTNFDLVREFMRELPDAPATDAWQRACLLARESPLDASREPRLKRSDETGELPTADHPFFWAGYLLVDTSPRPEGNGNGEPPEAPEVEQAEAADGNAQDAAKPPVKEMQIKVEAEAE